MATSSGNFPRRLTKIDDLTRWDYYHLRESDERYYLGEYTSHENYKYSRTNQLIHNFKKSMDRRPRGEWRYKELAIREVARALRRVIPGDLVDQLTFVPIPPSKARDHPLYDDRMTRMLCLIRPRPSLDVRELIIQTESTAAAHEMDTRPVPETIEAQYELDMALTNPAPRRLVLADDVLTTGAHFVLRRRFLSADIRKRRSWEYSSRGEFLALSRPNHLQLVEAFAV